MVPNQNFFEPMQMDIILNEDREDRMVMNPTLDLETYANGYTGIIKLQRLEFLADYCPPLRVEALKMAINDIVDTCNTSAYQRLHQKLADALRAGNEDFPDVISGQVVTLRDNVWIDQKMKKSAAKLEKLENDLKIAKSNSLKESVRRSHNDLGDHYLDCGDLDNAIKSYTRGRSYCTTARHVLNTLLNLVKVSIYMRNWHQVINCATKVESPLNEGGVDPKELTPPVMCYLNCALGVSEMSIRQYKTAARYFLQANVDYCDFPDLISANNVAIYGGLCALASFTRSELQRNVISNTGFKQFLELEPQLRDAIYNFYDSKYSSCLSSLDDLKDNLYLDLYLAPHINALYSEIRKRAIIQYFSPYLSADMTKMAQALNTTVDHLQMEVTSLISNNEMQARIDAERKVMYAKDNNLRNITFQRSVAVGKNYIKSAQMMILRNAMSIQSVNIKKNH